MTPDERNYTKNLKQKLPATPFFQTQVVRDLYSCIASPHLLSSENQDYLPLFEDKWAAKIVQNEEVLDWLHRLDTDSATNYPNSLSITRGAGGNIISHSHKDGDCNDLQHREEEENETVVNSFGQQQESLRLQLHDEDGRNSSLSFSKTEDQDLASSTSTTCCTSDLNYVILELQDTGTRKRQTVDLNTSRSGSQEEAALRQHEVLFMAQTSDTEAAAKQITVHCAEGVTSTTDNSNCDCRGASDLVNFLLQEKHHIRLGYYFSRLLEYFFSNCPVFFENCISRRDLGDDVVPRFLLRTRRNAFDDACKNRQTSLPRPSGGRSWDLFVPEASRSSEEVKRVVEQRACNDVSDSTKMIPRAEPPADHSSRTSQETTTLHVESAIHCSIAPEMSRLSEDTDIPAAADSSSNLKIRREDERFVLAARSNGAFLYESLLWRLLDYHERIQEVQEKWREIKLKTDGHSVATTAHLESALLLRGWVFWSFRDWQQTAFLSRQEQEGDEQQDVDPLSYEFLAPAAQKGSKAFCSGFWTKNFETDLRELKDKEVDHKPYRWVLLLHKRYWLSPCYSPDGQQLKGDSRISLDPLPLLSTANAILAIAEYQKTHPRNPLFISGMEEQQVVSCAPQDENSRRDAAATRTGSTPATFWQETIRGVVLPKKWETTCTSSKNNATADSTPRLEDCDSLAAIQQYLGSLILSDHTSSTCSTTSKANVTQSRNKLISENVARSNTNSCAKQKNVTDILRSCRSAVIAQSDCVTARAAAFLYMPPRPTHPLDVPLEVLEGMERVEGNGDIHISSSCSSSDHANTSCASTRLPQEPNKCSLYSSSSGNHQAWVKAALHSLIERRQNPCDADQHDGSQPHGRQVAQLSEGCTSKTKPRLSAHPHLSNFNSATAITYFFACLEKAGFCMASEALGVLLVELDRMQEGAPPPAADGVVGTSGSRGFAKIELGHLLCDGFSRWRQVQTKHTEWEAHLEQLRKRTTGDRNRKEKNHAPGWHANFIQLVIATYSATVATLLQMLDEEITAGEACKHLTAPAPKNVETGTSWADICSKARAVGGTTLCENDLPVDEKEMNKKPLSLGLGEFVLSDLRLSSLSGGCSASPFSAPSHAFSNHLGLKVLVKACRALEFDMPVEFQFQNAVGVDAALEVWRSSTALLASKMKAEAENLDAAGARTTAAEALSAGGQDHVVEAPCNSSSPRPPSTDNTNALKIATEGLREFLGAVCPDLGIGQKKGTGRRAKRRKKATACGDRDRARGAELLFDSADEHVRDEPDGFREDGALNNSDHTRNYENGNAASAPRSYFALPDTVQVLDCDPDLTAADFLNLVGTGNFSDSATQTLEKEQLQTQKVIALDCEWGGGGSCSSRRRKNKKSTHDGDDAEDVTVVQQETRLHPQVENGIALAQVAVSQEKVFLYDFLNPEHCKAFQTQVLANLASQKLIILGFSFQQDFRRLRATFIEQMNKAKNSIPIARTTSKDRSTDRPFASEATDCFKEVESLEVLRRLEKQAAFADGRPDTQFPRSLAIDLQGQDRRTGLARKAREELGLFLDKTHQRSDWCRRPLTEKQRAYAALDAWILLQFKISEVPPRS
ncbi:unnamed protein product [Amoebophrya sp. A120]|nr:unnamed protein product [Amoebophrya sp. A120]|eukprot:GSA120T00006348001.1